LFIGAAAGGVAVAFAGHLMSAVRVDQTVSGEVTLVNGPGNAICLNQDAGGSQLCSNVLQQRDEPVLQVGEHITVTRLIVNGSDAFVVVAREPPPS
jgi:hypothetical protein